MSSIGETLRRERLRRNLDLEQISRELKISQRFLDAIEEERFERLPAGVFARSFVRQYARLLDLDEEELAAEVDRAIKPADPVPNPDRPDLPPLPDIHLPRVEQWDAVGERRRFEWSSALPAAALLLVVLLVCSGVYAFWQRARQQPVTSQAPPPIETPGAPPQQAQVQPAQPPAAPPAESNPVPPPAATPEQPQPEAAAPPEAKPPLSVDRPAPEPPSNPNAPVRVQVTAEEAVWVLARADGKYLFSGTLEPSQSRSAEANEKLILRLGNAGGVAISLNGKPIGPIGPKGQVREVQFTSGGFQIVAAPKPSLPEDPI